jgi:ATP-dependent Clp protease adaptor protein ClpS
MTEDTDGGVITETTTETVTRHIPRYKVILHNDPKTTMDFVTHILMRFFEKDQMQAMKLMIQVHEEGWGLAGIYALEHAEFRVDQTVSLARANNFPLTLSIEPE